MADPIASSILLEIADILEAASPPTWRPNPGFKRRRAKGQDGGGLEDLPEPKDPRRTRRFDLFFESSSDDPSMASDEDRWCLQGVILVKLYYADVSSTADNTEGFLASRMQVDDHMILHRKLVQQNLVGAAIEGVSVLHNTQAVYLVGQTDWRITCRWEEIV